MKDDPLAPLFQLIFGVLAVLIVVLILIALLVLANRLRLKRKASLPHAKSVELQSELLEAIKNASANQRTVVNIRPFWRDHKVRAIDRHAVIEPLVDRGDVTEVHPPEVGEPWETLRDLWQLAMYRPATRLVLTDRTWTRMVHEGITGRGIVIGSYVEKADQVNEYKMDTGGGDAIASPWDRKREQKMYASPKATTSHPYPSTS